MKSREAALRISCLVYLLTLLSPDALAQPNSKLDQAYNLLVQGQYQPAVNTANAYLAGNPRRYRAEFIIAVAECSLHRGQQGAMQRIAALKRDYVLTDEAQREVEDWIAYCKTPKPPKPPKPEVSEAGVGVSTSSLETAPPQVKSAAANKPSGTPLPPMSALVAGTSYSGDDYSELKGIATADDCSRACRLQAPCRSMTYAISSKTCWLKRSVPPAQPGADFVSAVKRAN